MKERVLKHIEALIGRVLLAVLIGLAFAFLQQRGVDMRFGSRLDWMTPVLTKWIISAAAFFTIGEALRRLVGSGKAAVGMGIIYLCCAWWIGLKTWWLLVPPPLLAFGFYRSTPPED